MARFKKRLRTVEATGDLVSNDFIKVKAGSRLNALSLRQPLIPYTDELRALFDDADPFISAAIRHISSGNRNCLNVRVYVPKNFAFIDTRKHVHSDSNRIVYSVV